MSDKPRKRKPSFEIYSPQHMPPECWQDLLEFVARFKAENVDSFYCLVNKKPRAPEAPCKTK